MKKYKYILFNNDNELIALLESFKGKGITDYGHMPFCIGRKGQVGIDPEVLSMYPTEVSIMRYAEPLMKIEITAEMCYNNFSDTWEFGNDVWMPKEAHGKIFKVTLEEIQ